MNIPNKPSQYWTLTTGLMIPSGTNNKAAVVCNTNVDI